MTDEDIRQPQVHESIMRQCSFCPISKLTDGMEVHIHNTNVDAHVRFNLFVNHNLCLASFELNDVYELGSDIQIRAQLCRFRQRIQAEIFITVNRHRRRYWDYIRRHPAHVLPSKLALQDVVEALTWYYVRNSIFHVVQAMWIEIFVLQTENLISGAESIVPFSKTECEDLLRILRNTTSRFGGAFVAYIFIAFPQSTQTKALYQGQSS